MAADLSTLPTTGLLVQACGDAHIANFGGYRSPESHLVFDLNDFDETTRGHWEWDVERLVASVAICGRTRGFGDKWCREAVRLAAQSYRESLAYFATLGSFDVWRAYLDVAEVLQGLADKVSKDDRRQVADDWNGPSPRPTSGRSRNWCVWKTANPRWSTIRRISCRSAIFSPWTTSGASSAAWRACSTTTAQR